MISWPRTLPASQHDPAALHRRWTSVLLLCAALACGSAQALSGGQVDGADAYAGVVLLVDDGGGRCTAVKFAPRRLLTAAHCVADLVNGGLRSSFRTGGTLGVGAAPILGGGEHLESMVVVRTLLAPAFADGLERFVAYKRQRGAELGADRAGSDAMARLQSLSAQHHFSARFPDAAVIELGADLKGVPVLELTRDPVARGDVVTLVGYGCDDIDGARPETGGVARRRFGASEVIRVESVNIYTYGRRMRAGAVSLCPGDSGGPVMRAGRVVGIHGTVHGRWRDQGARSNRSVGLSSLTAWSALFAP